MIPYTDLCILSELYGTDKRPEPLGHGYTHYYHALLDRRRESIRKVVEIGIDMGASLRMWRDYFPSATVYGLDCDRNKLITEERIESYLCDQSIADSLQDISFRIGSNIDFMVDDGSHETGHQIMSAMAYVPLLAKGGIYVIEDVLHPNLVVSNLPFPCHTELFHVDRDPWSKLVVIHAV